MINEEWFKKLRFDEYHHLGLGDIRLTIGQQEEILAEITSLDFLHKLDHSLADQWRAKNEELNEEANRNMEELCRLRGVLEKIRIVALGNHQGRILEIIKNET